MSVADPQESPAGAAARADVRLVHGRLTTDELAAIAVVVSTMSVTSRIEAQERALAEGLPGTDAWCDPIHTHPRSHHLRTQPSATAWQFADR